MSRVPLGRSSRLVFPHARGGPIAYERSPGGLWRREGLQIPDSVRLASLIRAEGWVDGEEQDILELWFQGAALPNDPTHIGLFTTTPADDATGGVEVSGGSYARQPFANTATEWGSSAAGAPSTIESLLAVTFPQASANWGTVASWGYFTALTAGSLLFFAVLDTAKAVNSGDTAEFAAGGLGAQLGDPGDSY